MKKIAASSFFIFCLLIVVLIVYYFKGTNVSNVPPEKPDIVPENAFWTGGVDGGNFIVVIDKFDSSTVFYAEIYNDYTGELEYSGKLKYSGVMFSKDKLNSNEFYDGWDGDSLYLTNGEYMKIF